MFQVEFSDWERHVLITALSKVHAFWPYISETPWVEITDEEVLRLMDKLLTESERKEVYLMESER